MTERHNVLIIHADQHRYDCLGAYGNADVRTPNIDGLARDGVVFANSFTPFPICAPSRYSLLTGLYARQHLVTTNRGSPPAGYPTLPALLRDAGYSTAAVGKMHLTPTYLDVGFDKLMLAEQNGDGRWEDDYHRWLRDEGLCDRLDLIDQEAEFRRDAPQQYWDTCGALRSDLDEAHHSTTWIADRAVETIERWTPDANFLMVGFIKPHHPFDPPAPWDTMYDPDALALLPGWTESLMHGDDGSGYFDFSGLTERQLRRAMAFYYATISQIDHHVGRMIDMLKEKGLHDDTMVVYTSDHGDYMGYHHRILKGYRMLEPLVRVPLIIKHAGRKHPSLRKDDRLVSGVDVAPTVLSSAGLDVPGSMSGLDLLDPEAYRDYVFAESRREVMVRSVSRKLLLARDDRRSLFFDLESDPLEMANLYRHPDYREEVSAFKDRLTHWIAFEAVPPPHADTDARQVRAGYLACREDLYPYFKMRMDEKDFGFTL